MSRLDFNSVWEVKIWGIVSIIRKIWGDRGVDPDLSSRPSSAQSQRDRAINKAGDWPPSSKRSLPSSVLGFWE